MCLCTSIGCSFLAKHSLVVLEQGLDGDTLCLNVRELPLNVHRTHNGRREDDSEVKRSHLDMCQ
jgi:hypothetical protein